MIVITQPKYQAALPQPSGPSIKREDESDVAIDFSTDIGSTNADRPGKPVLAKRVMTRSTSVFQQSTCMSSSSRSSSPLSSCRTSSQAQLPSTPASSAPSSSKKGDIGRSRSARKVKLEPVIEINASPTQSPTTPLPAGSLDLVDDPAAIPYDVPTDVPIPPFAKRSSHPERDLARVWEAVAGARRITVICGAGISVSSPANIPDFRSTAGLFRKLKEKHPNAGLTSGKDLFDASLFNSPSTSSIFYSMVAELKAMADAASPTTFHHLLKRLDMEGRLQRVYTQNIDGLEERAGLSFGLGESGDSRATLRALGKRKRGMQKGQLSRTGFARSKSDSAVVFTQKQEAQRLCDSFDDTSPMFPRAIPLHGSLSTLTCGVCNHKVYLSLASSGPPSPASQREYSPDAPDQALAAMDLLSQGESVSCVKCQDYERVRSVAGLRSRGVGVMKVDVVLYNGQNDGAEQVGECVQRDILGLRDPNEASVPESIAERKARERREKKDQDLQEKGKESLECPSPALAAISEANSADDVLAAAFDDTVAPEEASDSKGVAGGDLMSWSLPTPPRKVLEAPRRKPLPPDLLIVAGTSLKVPGTKRIVREFAKACHARDYRVYLSSDESEEEEESKKGKGRSRRGSKKNSEEPSNEANSSDVEEEEEDINAPIRTILLNYDFPVPPSQWEDVFDVWVQGDVQQSALGLWEASAYAAKEGVNGFSMQDDEHHQLPQPQLSWSALMTVLEIERKAARKSAMAAKKNNAQQEKSVAALRDLTPPPSQQAKITNTISKKDGQSDAVKTKVQTKTTAPQAETKKAPITKKAAEKTAGQEKKSTSRSTAKASTMTIKAKPAEIGVDTFMRPTKATAKKVSGKKASAL